MIYHLSLDRLLLRRGFSSTHLLGTIGQRYCYKAKRKPYQTKKQRQKEGKKVSCESVLLRKQVNISQKIHLLLLAAAEVPIHALL